jgi:hypothetical protein
MSTNGKTQLQIRRPIFPEPQSNCFEEARERGANDATQAV